MSTESDFLEACEVHSPEGIQRALAGGVSATTPIHDKTPIDCLIEGYLRSPRFADCLRVLINAGATTDPLLLALLFDDDAELQRQLAVAPQLTDCKLDVPCAFTSCTGVTPLHVCAEYNCVRSARALLAAGADVNARASLDSDAIGGHTPLFHAVNSIFNYCRPMLELLIDAGALLDVKLKGIAWGVGQPWETLILDVTPMSYAQCGLYAQFHRSETDVYSNLAYLYKSRYQAELPLKNVPNKYLQPK